MNKTKIAYISGSTIPSRKANSINVMKMCSAFSNSGYKVILFAILKKNIPKNKCFEFYGVKPTFNIQASTSMSNNLFYFLYSVFRAKQKSVDLIYTRSLLAAYISAVIRTPVTLEIHGPYLMKTQKFIFRKLIKLNNFKKIVVISKALKKYFHKKYNIPTNKVIVAHDGSDIIRDHKKIKLSPTNLVHIGYIGQLYKGKGMELIIKIAPYCSNTIFHIIGGTENDISFWKQKAKNINNIIFHGFVPHKKTILYHNSCDILIAPYQKKVIAPGGNNIANWMSPLKIFEYMAAGKPIICSKLPVLEEILIHNKNAILCDPENEKEWINAIKELYQNKEKANQLGINAKKTFLNKYTWESRAKNIMEHIK